MEFSHLLLLFFATIHYETNKYLPSAYYTQYYRITMPSQLSKGRSRTKKEPPGDETTLSFMFRTLINSNRKRYRVQQRIENIAVPKRNSKMCNKFHLKEKEQSNLLEYYLIHHRIIIDIVRNELEC